MEQYVGILLVAHAPMCQAILSTITHIYGKKLPHIESIPVKPHHSPQDLLNNAVLKLKKLDNGQGVILLTDLPGSTPANLALMLLTHTLTAPLRVVTGVNLPMVLRVINYSHVAELDALVEKALSGGKEGMRAFTVNEQEILDD